MNCKEGETMKQQDLPHLFEWLDYPNLGEARRGARRMLRWFSRNTQISSVLGYMAERAAMETEGVGEFAPDYFTRGE